MEENSLRKKKRIINVLIQTAPQKVEQNDLGKKINITSYEIASIYKAHIKKMNIVERKKDDKKRVFYRIPEEKIVKALERAKQ